MPFFSPLAPSVVPQTRHLRSPALASEFLELFIVYSYAGEKANGLFCSLVMVALHLKQIVLFLAALFYLVIFRLPERGFCLFSVWHQSRNNKLLILLPIPWTLGFQFFEPLHSSSGTVCTRPPGLIPSYAFESHAPFSASVLLKTLTLQLILKATTVLINYIFWGEKRWKEL